MPAPRDSDDGITRCWVQVTGERDTALKARDQWRDLASSYLCELQRLTGEMKAQENEMKARENDAALKEGFDHGAHGTELEDT